MFGYSFVLFFLPTHSSRIMKMSIESKALWISSKIPKSKTKQKHNNRKKTKYMYFFWVFYWMLYPIDNRIDFSMKCLRFYIFTMKYCTIFPFGVLFQKKRKINKQKKNIYTLLLHIKAQWRTKNKKRKH